MRSLFGSVAIGTTGFFTAVAMTPLLAEDLIGETWSGVPSTAMVLSTAAGTAVLSRLMAARGRRPGLVTGYAVGAVGAAGVVVAAQTSTFALMVVASLAIGGSQAANQLSRYAAADLHPSESRGAALGLVVWAGTVGALLGPNMLPVAGSVAERLGGRALAGPHGFAAAAMVLAALVCAVRLRPDPRELVVADDVGETVEGVDRRAAVRVAVTALIAGQVVMVLIMTMTPVHIRHSGSGLSMVGGVMSAHIVGMYAFTPVVGRLADRFGSLRVIAGGLTALGAAGVGAASIPGGGGLGAPLFLLGIGWSATFVAGSALLTGGLPYAERVRLQGIVDTVVWSSSAAASLVSGLVLSTAGYGVLGASGTGLAVAAAVVVLALREPVRPVPEPSA